MARDCQPNRYAYGMPVRQLELLAKLEAKPEASVAELASSMEITAATIARYVCELRQAGYLFGTRVTEVGADALTRWRAS